LNPLPSPLYRLFPKKKKKKLKKNSHRCRKVETAQRVLSAKEFNPQVYTITSA
jgi:hypothetical protein